MTGAPPEKGVPQLFPEDEGGSLRLFTRCKRTYFTAHSDARVTWPTSRREIGDGFPGAGDGAYLLDTLEEGLFEDLVSLKTL